MSEDNYTHRAAFPGQPVHVVETLELTQGRKAVHIRKLYQEGDDAFCDNGDGSREVLSKERNCRPNRC